MNVTVNEELGLSWRGREMTYDNDDLATGVQNQNNIEARNNPA